VPLTPVLTKRFDTDQPWKIENYEALDGYAALRKALRMNPDDIITMVKDSGLRGRGGAGFPTGMKWQFIPQAKPGEAAKPHYVVVNADEGEPGTCRDLPLMMNDPHSMIEGIIIACFAVRADRAFVYIRGEAVHAIRRVTRAVMEAQAKGYLGRNILGTGFSCSIVVHNGAGAYICGEETALLDSLEGKRGQPRLKPPFPATNGLYDAPTVVNNVGTLASVPYIVMGGAEWFKGQVADNPLTDDGKNPSAGSPGTCIYSLSGRIKNPGQYEAPMGTTLRELIDMAGGMSRGKALKFWTPGGSSTPMFSDAELDIPLDFDSAVKAGSMNGTSAVMIFDEDDSVVRAVLKWTEFYEHESCGKCTPCREGNYWTAQILERIWHGHGTMADLDALLDICDNILGRSFCALGDGAVSPIQSSLKYFRDEYLALVKDNPPTLVPGDPVAAPEPAMSLATSGAVK
jgi:NADH-quinone oxidoreductase subunit F